MTLKYFPRQSTLVLLCIFNIADSMVYDPAETQRAREAVKWVQNNDLCQHRCHLARRILRLYGWQAHGNCKSAYRKFQTLPLDDRRSCINPQSPDCRHVPGHERRVCTFMCDIQQYAQQNLQDEPEPDCLNLDRWENMQPVPLAEITLSFGFSDNQMESDIERPYTGSPSRLFTAEHRTDSNIGEEEAEQAHSSSPKPLTLSDSITEWPKADSNINEEAASYISDHHKQQSDSDSRSSGAQGARTNIPIKAPTVDEQADRFISSTHLRIKQQSKGLSFNFLRIPSKFKRSLSSRKNGA